MSLDDRNATLDEQLHANPIDETIAVLTRADQRNRRHIILLAISLVFDLLLTVILAFGWQSNHNLAVKAETNHSAIVRSCETSNEARAKNKEIWSFLLETTVSTPRTPEEQAFRDKFEAKVNDTFAPRNCLAETNKQ